MCALWSTESKSILIAVRIRSSGSPSALTRSSLASAAASYSPCMRAITATALLSK